MECSLVFKSFTHNHLMHHYNTMAKNKSKNVKKNTRFKTEVHFFVICMSITQSSVTTVTYIQTCVDTESSCTICIHLSKFVYLLSSKTKLYYFFCNLHLHLQQKSICVMFCTKNCLYLSKAF